ncbi:MAG: carboxypeptidase regulatory-like domain-containing protein [Pyrinomonadaceae bacterium]
MKIKILTISVLLSMTNAMAFVASHQSSTTKVTGELSGTVVDMNEARVSGATVTIEGEALTRAIATAEDGTYKIELPVGTYRIKAARTGFCPARRAPFRALSSTSIILNFTLIPCSIVNDITIKNGQYVGETDRYKDPFKEEVFPLVHPSGASLELLVRYGARQENPEIIEYRGTVVSYDEHADTPTGSIRREKYLGVTFSYDSLMIRADKVQLDPKTFRLEAEGNVVIEDGKRCVTARRALVDLRTDEPSRLLKNR